MLETEYILHQQKLDIGSDGLRINLNLNDSIAIHLHHGISGISIALPVQMNYRSNQLIIDEFPQRMANEPIFDRFVRTEAEPICCRPLPIPNPVRTGQYWPIDYGIFNLFQLFFCPRCCCYCFYRCKAYGMNASHSVCLKMITFHSQ